MRSIFLLCASIAVIIATEPIVEGAAVQIHPDEEQQVQMPEGINEVEPLPVEKPEGEMQADVKYINCPASWPEYGSRCFRFIYTEMTWMEAERYCLRFRTNLASVHSNREYEFIQELVSGSSGGSFTRSWIGANDAVKNSEWLWSDGSPFGFADWGSNGSGNGKCAVMNQPDDFRWSTTDCTAKLPFVCGTRPDKDPFTL